MNKKNQESLNNFIKLIDDNCTVQCIEKLDSTNLYARRVLDNIITNHIIVACTQTNGQGTYERSFFSPKDKGLYFSIILKNVTKKISIEKLMMLSAISIKEAVLNVANIDLEIKWANDLYYSNKKVSGILINKVNNNIIIGIGINLYKDEGIVNTIKDATYLLEPGIHLDTDQLITKIYQNILYYFEHQKDILALYKKYSLVLNKSVIIKTDRSNDKYYVLDHNSDGSLKVITRNDEIINLEYGKARVLIDG